MVYNESPAPSLNTVLHALGNPNRAHIFSTLCNQELLTEDLMELFNERYLNMRKHLKVLEAGGLISSYKDGKYRYYHANKNSLKYLTPWVTSLSTILDKRSY